MFYVIRLQLQWLMLTQLTNSFLPWCKNFAILHKFHHIWSSDCAFFPSWFSRSHRLILQELWKDIADGLMWKVKPWAYFFILIARRSEGNYFFPLWNRSNAACHRSQLTIFQYEKLEEDTMMSGINSSSIPTSIWTRPQRITCSFNFSCWNELWIFCYCPRWCSF